MWIWKANRSMQKLKENIDNGTMVVSDDVKDAVERYADFVGNAYKLVVSNQGMYSPAMEQYFFEEPHVKRFGVSFHEVLNNISLMRCHDIPALSKIAQYMEDELRYHYWAFKTFPALTADDITAKYHGFHFDAEKLLSHMESERYSPFDSRVLFADNDGDILHMQLVWANEEEYMRDAAPFTITLADIRLRMQYGYEAAASFGSIISMECFETHDGDFLYSDEEDAVFTGREIFEQEEKVSVPVNENHIMHLDYLLSLYVEPMVPSGIEWRFELDDIPAHSVSVTPEINPELSYCCCSPDFTVDCDAVPHCCGECPMLKYIYNTILPKALDEASMENLRNVVEPTGLFQHTDKCGQSICFASCKKDDTCSETVRTAVDELYRYYYEVQRKMFPQSSV